MKRIAAIMIASLFVLTAFAVLEMPMAKAATPTQNFSFPYSYGQPQVPSDVGAQGTQGPSFYGPFSGSHMPIGHVGQNGTTPGSYFQKIPAVIFIQVYNGTPSSKSYAIRQDLYLQNVTTGKYFPSITNATGVAVFTLWKGYWTLQVNASASSHINFAQQLDVNISQFNKTVFLIPSSYTTTTINNGASTTTTLTIWATINLPQMKLILLNGTTNPDTNILGVAYAGNNGTASFTKVSTSYQYQVSFIGYNSSLTGIVYSFGNLTYGYTILPTVGQTSITAIHPEAAQWKTTAVVTGTTFPSEYSGGVWTITTPTVVTGGVVYIGGDIEPTNASNSITFINDVVYFNATQADTKTITIINSTVIRIASVWNNEIWKFLSPPATINFHASYAGFYLGQDYGVQGFSYMNNSYIFDTYEQVSSASNPPILWLNDAMYNSTFFEWPTVEHSYFYNDTFTSSPNITTNISSNTFVFFNGYFGALTNTKPVDVFNNFFNNTYGISEQTASISKSKFENNWLTFNETTALQNARAVSGYQISFYVSNFSYNYVNESQFPGSNMSLEMENGYVHYFYSNYVTNNVSSSIIYNHYFDTTWSIPVMTLVFPSNITISRSYFEINGYNFPTEVQLNEPLNVTIKNSIFSEIAGSSSTIVASNTPPSGFTHESVIISNDTFQSNYWNQTLMNHLGGALHWNDLNGLTVWAMYQNVIPAYVEITHDSFFNWMSGTGVPHDILVMNDLGITNVSYSLFDQRNVNGEMPYTQHPIGAYLDLRGSVTNINNNWFIGVNNNTKMAAIGSVKGDQTFSNNRVFPYPFPGHTSIPSWFSTNISKSGFSIPVVNGSSKYIIVSKNIFPITNQSYTQVSPQGGYGGQLYTYSADFNTLTGVLSYSNGLVGGPQPNFTWQGYKYTESVEPSYIQVGANSTKAPPINLQFNGAPNTAYSIAMYDHGKLIDYTNVTSSANGVVTFTYNPATMPLDPVFELTTISASMPPPTPVSNTFLYLEIGLIAVLSVGLVIPLIIRRQYR